MTFGLKTLPYNGTEKIEDPNNQSKRFGGNAGKKKSLLSGRNPWQSQAQECRHLLWLAGGEGRKTGQDTPWKRARD